MTRYEADIDEANPNSSHTQVLDLVGEGKRVLDVGCATGYLARHLVANGCTVSGIELDAGAAEEARPFLDRLVIGNLNDVLLSESFEAASFDVIVFADVLEHVLDPAAVLRDSLSLLAPGGRVVFSVPNVSHGSLRLALLQGRWNYTDTGLLDRTHVVFFTYETLVALVLGAGLGIDVARATVTDPLSANIDIDTDRIPATTIEWVRHQPRALDFQYVLSASLPVEGTAPGAPTNPTQVLPAEVARAQDAFTAEAVRDEELRHRALTVRDHVVGLEATAAHARSHADELSERFEERRASMEKTIAEQHATIEQLAAERLELRSSATWRAGSALLMPLRVTNRILGRS